jgi:hypothetical protein
MVPLDHLKPYDKNPRNNDEAVPQVVKSIQEFGFQQPIVVDKNYVIIVGHTRFLAAKKLELLKVPVVIADLTDAKAKAYRLMDNRTHERSTWDDTLLIQEVMELGDFYSPTFLDFDHLDFPVDDETEQGDPDEVPDEVPAITKPGDMYLLDPYYECTACKKIYPYPLVVKECDCGVAA